MAKRDQNTKKDGTLVSVQWVHNKVGWGLRGAQGSSGWSFLVFCDSVGGTDGMKREKRKWFFFFSSDEGMGVWRTQMGIENERMGIS